jgi:lysozyme
MNDVATQLAVKLISQVEGCELRSYPDPASPLYKALSKENLLRKYMDGKVVIPDRLSSLSGTPWTIGVGETKGITKGMVWTASEATSKLQKRVEGFVSEVLSASPALASGPPERLAAVTSLVYNIGISNYITSTVARMVKAGKHKEAAAAFLLWNKAKGEVMSGLVKRRKIESELYLTGKG